jgi:hypothetical protein
MTLIRLAIITFLSVSLFSCKKIGTINSNACPSIKKLEIITNSPVIEGWPLTLSTRDDISFLYRWAGPIGWENGMDSSQAYLRGKLVTTMADAGIYKILRKYSDGCVYDTGSAVVKIIPPPLPPCNVVNNSSTSNVIGVGGVLYSNIYFYGDGGIFTIQSSAGGQTITYNFNGNTPPKPGIYKTSGYFAKDETTVGIYITASPYTFINNSGQDVYVNLVNGKTQVTFCNCVFTNPLGSTVIKISSKITEP